MERERRRRTAFELLFLRRSVLSIRIFLKEEKDKGEEDFASLFLFFANIMGSDAKKGKAPPRKNLSVSTAEKRGVEKDEKNLDGPYSPMADVISEAEKRYSAQFKELQRKSSAVSKAAVGKKLQKKGPSLPAALEYEMTDAERRYSEKFKKGAKAAKKVAGTKASKSSSSKSSSQTSSRATSKSMNLSGRRGGSGVGSTASKSSKALVSKKASSSKKASGTSASKKKTNSAATKKRATSSSGKKRKRAPAVPAPPLPSSPPSSDEDKDESVDETPKHVYTFGRKTRGKRMTTLIGEEADADAQFWGQDAWAEKAEDLDDDIQSDEFGSEASDIEDADFDAANEDTDEDEVVVAPEKKRSKRGAGVYVDPASIRRTGAMKVKRKKRQRVQLERVERTFRSTTTEKAAVARAQQMREEKERKNRRKKLDEARKKKPCIVNLTQQQLLEEAVRTEAENRRSLLLLLHMQEEKKRQRGMGREKEIRGPRIIFRSNKQGSTLTFKGVQSVPVCISSEGPNYPVSRVCSVTGAPAKYLDPLTGCYYANAAAFKQLRLSSGNGASTLANAATAAHGTDQKPPPKPAALARPHEPPIAVAQNAAS